MSVKIRKGDTVQVVTGKRNDKGKRGEVIKVIPKENRVVVQGINIRKKHQSQVQTQARGGQLNPGIIELEGSIDVSNLMVVCPQCNQPSRMGIQRDEDGIAHRVCKNCEAVID